MLGLNLNRQMRVEMPIYANRQYRYVSGNVIGNNINNSKIKWFVDAKWSFNQSIWKSFENATNRIALSNNIWISIVICGTMWNAALKWIDFNLTFDTRRLKRYYMQILVHISQMQRKKQANGGSNKLERSRDNDWIRNVEKQKLVDTIIQKSQSDAN